jgi:nitric oxide dioxygenase
MTSSLDLRKLVSYSTGGITSKVVFKSDVMNITLFCMAAGTNIEEHTAAKEGTVHVIEGKGRFTLAGTPIAMMPGILIRMKAHQPHTIKADKNTSFLLTLTK